MATTTLAELETQLANVNKAINDSLTAGQSYSRTGFSLSRVAMADLVKLKATLESQIRKMNTGIASVPDFSGATGDSESDQWGD